jgi:O-antigen/teichoic acid export membrane protein
MTYLAPWLIAWTHGEAATGVLAACVTVVNVVGMFVTGVSNALTPRAARAYSTGGMASLRTVLMESLAVFLVTIGGFCAFLALTGDLLVTFVYGDRFAGAALVLLLLALQMLMNSLGIVAGNGLWAVNRPRANFLADVATLVASAGAMALSIPGYGVTGAAFGLLAGTTIGAAIRTWTLLQMLRHASAAAGRTTGEATP